MKKVIALSLILLLITLISIVVIFALFPKKYRDDIVWYAREYDLSASMVASVIITYAVRSIAYPTMGTPDAIPTGTPFFLK